MTDPVRDFYNVGETIECHGNNEFISNFLALHSKYNLKQFKMDSILPNYRLFIKYVHEL